MPYRVIEHIPGRLLYYIIWDELRAEDMVESNKEVHSYMDVQSTKVNIISNFLHMTSYSRDIAKLSSTFTLFKHDNHGWTVPISNDAVFKFVANLTVEMIKRASNSEGGLRAVNTEQAAIEKMESLVPDIAPIPALPDLATMKAARPLSEMVG